jgi:hypothetical protein
MNEIFINLNEKLTLSHTHTAGSRSVQLEQVESGCHMFA